MNFMLQTQNYRPNKTVEGRKSGDDSSSTVLRESKSSAEHGQESEANTPRAHIVSAQHVRI